MLRPGRGMGLGSFYLIVLVFFPLCFLQGGREGLACEEGKEKGGGGEGRGGSGKEEDLRCYPRRHRHGVAVWPRNDERVVQHAAAPRDARPPHGRRRLDLERDIVRCCCARWHRHAVGDGGGGRELLVGQGCVLAGEEGRRGGEGCEEKEAHFGLALMDVAFRMWLGVWV